MRPIRRRIRPQRLISGSSATSAVSGSHGLLMAQGGDAVRALRQVAMAFPRRP